MPSGMIKLTAKSKLKEIPEGLDDLFFTYREIVNFLLTYAFENNLTSFYRLKRETYKGLRKEYPELPSHYLYTPCQMATSIYKSYRKRKRKGSNPALHFKRRTSFEFYPAKYHEKFKDWKVGQAWLIKTLKGVFINVVFSKELEVREPKAFVGMDLNENNITLALPNGEFVQIITYDREIRTGYFLKRWRIQKKIRAGNRREELLQK